MTYLSPSVRQVLGRDPETMLGTLGTRWIHDDDHEHTIREMERVVRDNGRSTIQFRTRHADGSWRWIEATVGAYRGASGGSRVVSISRDVTDQHERQESLRRSHVTLEQRVEDRTVQLQQAVEELEREVAARRNVESELRTSYERYRIVSELSSDYSFGLEILEHGTVRTLWVTDAFPRLTGYTAAEMEQLGWGTLLDPEFRETARSLFARALEGKTVEFEGRAVTKAGAPWWIHTRFLATRIGSGDGCRVIGSSRDVTDRRQAEEGRRQLEAHMSEIQRLDSLGVLAGGIAHDFNNLLSVILGNTALAQSDVPENSEVVPRLTRIRSAALHGAGLTEQMLTYSGKTPFTPAPTDLSRVVNETRDLLEASIGRQCRLTFEPATDLPAVDGDETQLRQIVVNLVTNAAEALGERGGDVHMCMRAVKLDTDELNGAFGSSEAVAGEYVVIEVQDDGPGMDPATQERIFDPFFTTRRSGRGLGLAAVLGIVRGHRGVILLESESGRGTTIRVCLPVSMELARAADAAPQGTPARPVHPNATVLVIDDEEDVLEIGGEFLKRAGFSVLTAQSGRKAIAMLEANRDTVDVVVLDLVMPDMDGEETLSELQLIRSDLRVIVVSGYDQERTSNRFKPGQVAHFIRKPYEPEDLIEKVHAALES
jgi:two-component system cell cycle sensor histidine kinase/response regulator CckA